MSDGAEDKKSQEAGAEQPEKAEQPENREQAEKPRPGSSSDVLKVSGANLYGSAGGLSPNVGQPLKAGSMPGKQAPGKMGGKPGMGKMPAGKMGGQPGMGKMPAGKMGGQPGMGKMAAQPGAAKMAPGQGGAQVMGSQPMGKPVPGKAGPAQPAPGQAGAAAGQAQAGWQPQVNMQEINYMFGQAQQALQQRRKPEAEAACRQILQLVPQHLGALRMLAALRGEAGDGRAVANLLSRALRAHPHDDQVLVDAARFLESTGRVRRAEQNYARAARLNPRNIEAQVGLGRMAQRGGNANAAEHHYRQAYYLRPGAQGVASSLATVLNNLNRFEESERFFRIAMALNPKDTGTLLGWAKMEEGRNDLARANHLLALAHEQQPDFPMIGMTEAQIHRRNKEYDEAIADLDKIQIDKLRPGMQAAYWYERGNTLDKAKRYDEAFEAYDHANQINREQLSLKYRADRIEDQAKRLKEFFMPEMVEKLPTAKPGGEHEPLPIFICGFTRSGTSLVEQILGSHPDICPGDELFFIAELAQNAPRMVQSRLRYPECLEELAQPDKRHLVQHFRNNYLSRVRMTAILEPGARRFTDKMPMNEFNMGLIHLAFPDTHFVHMVRHPLDTVLASYFIDARHGQFCTYGLETAARHYVTLVELANHYRAAMPDLNYLRVRYEDVVADNKAETEKLLQFLGEPWDDACLEYYKSERTPRTPSYADVKQKIYTGSTYRYRNYRKHVDAIIPILEPCIKEFGYTVED